MGIVFVSLFVYCNGIILSDHVCKKSSGSYGILMCSSCRFCRIISGTCNHQPYSGAAVDDLISYDKEESLGLGVPPKGKHVFGMVKVGDKGQIVIPAKARKIFDIKPGDNLLVLGDEGQGIAIMKEQGLLDMLKAIRN